MSTNFSVRSVNFSNSALPNHYTAVTRTLLVSSTLSPNPSSYMPGASLSHFTGRDMVPSRRPLFQSTSKNRHNNCASSGVDVALAPLVKSSFGARTYQTLYDMLSPCSIFTYPRETFANVSARPWAPRFRPLYAGWSLPHKRKSGGAHSTLAAPT